jgi:hypothetical protein
MRRWLGWLVKFCKLLVFWKDSDVVEHISGAVDLAFDVPEATDIVEVAYDNHGFGHPVSGNFSKVSSPLKEISSPLGMARPGDPAYHLQQAMQKAAEKSEYANSVEAVIVEDGVSAVADHGGRDVHGDVVVTDTTPIDSRRELIDPAKGGRPIPRRGVQVHSMSDTESEGRIAAYEEHRRDLSRRVVAQCPSYSLVQEIMVLAASRLTPELIAEIEEEARAGAVEAWIDKHGKFAADQQAKRMNQLLLGYIPGALSYPAQLFRQDPTVEGDVLVTNRPGSKVPGG